MKRDREAERGGEGREGEGWGREGAACGDVHGNTPGTHR